MAQFVKRTNPVPDGAPPERVSDEWMERSYPALWEYLSVQSFEDGSPRTTSTLLLFVEEGRVKGCLNDREEGQSTWGVSDSVEGLLACLDGRLRDGTAEWRKSQGFGRRKAK